MDQCVDAVLVGRLPRSPSVPKHRAGEDATSAGNGSGRLSAALAAVVVACATLGGAAWFASPSPSALGHRVEARLRGTGGRAIPLGKMPLILPRRGRCDRGRALLRPPRNRRRRRPPRAAVRRDAPVARAGGEHDHRAARQASSTSHGNDHSPWRKLEDAAVAVKLELGYSKATILAAYLNSAYFGEQAYGVQAAAERYFGLPAALARSGASDDARRSDPGSSVYDPLRNPELGRARQTEVLRSLVRSGYFAEAHAARVLAQPLRLRKPASCSRRSSTSTSHRHRRSSGGSSPLARS